MRTSSDIYEGRRAEDGRDESSRRDAANLEGALQTRAIRAGTSARREDVLARQKMRSHGSGESDDVEVQIVRNGWRPRRPWHWYELVRTVAAAVQVAVGLAILLKVY